MKKCIPITWRVVFVNESGPLNIRRLKPVRMIPPDTMSEEGLGDDDL